MSSLGRLVGVVHLVWVPIIIITSIIFYRLRRVHPIVGRHPIWVMISSVAMVAFSLTRGAALVWGIPCLINWGALIVWLPITLYCVVLRQWLLLFSFELTADLIAIRTAINQKQMDPSSTHAHGAIPGGASSGGPMIGSVGMASDELEDHDDDHNDNNNNDAATREPAPLLTPRRQMAATSTAAATASAVVADTTTVAITSTNTHGSGATGRKSGVRAATNPKVGRGGGGGGGRRRSYAGGVAALLNWHHSWYSRHVSLARRPFLIRVTCTLIFLLLFTWIVPAFRIGDPRAGSCLLDQSSLGESVERWRDVVFKVILIIYVIFFFAIGVLTFFLRPHEHDSYGLKHEFQTIQFVLILFIIIGPITVKQVENNRGPILELLMALVTIGIVIATVIWPLYLVVRFARLQRLRRDMVRRIDRLEDLLAIPQGFDAFLAFCSSEFTSENVLFVHHVSLFQKKVIHTLGLPGDESSSREDSVRISVNHGATGNGGNGNGNGNGNNTPSPPADSQTRSPLLSERFNRRTGVGGSSSSVPLVRTGNNTPPPPLTPMGLAATAASTPITPNIPGTPNAFLSVNHTTATSLRSPMSSAMSPGGFSLATPATPISARTIDINTTLAAPPPNGHGLWATRSGANTPTHGNGHGQGQVPPSARDHIHHDQPTTPTTPVMTPSSPVIFGMKAQPGTPPLMGMNGSPLMSGRRGSLTAAAAIGLTINPASPVVHGGTTTAAATTATSGLATTTTAAPVSVSESLVDINVATRLLAEAFALYDTYLSPDAMHEVNISAPERAVIHQRLNAVSAKVTSLQQAAMNTNDHNEKKDGGGQEHDRDSDHETVPLSPRVGGIPIISPRQRQRSARYLSPESPNGNGNGNGNSRGDDHSNDITMLDGPTNPATNHPPSARVPIHLSSRNPLSPNGNPNSNLNGNGNGQPDNNGNGNNMAGYMTVMEAQELGLELSHIFHDASAAIMRLLQQNSWVRFRSSPQFESFLKHSFVGWTTHAVFNAPHIPPQHVQQSRNSHSPHANNVGASRIGMASGASTPVITLQPMIPLAMQRPHDTIHRPAPGHGMAMPSQHQSPRSSTPSKSSSGAFASGAAATPATPPTGSGNGATKQLQMTALPTATASTRTDTGTGTGGSMATNSSMTITPAPTTTHGMGMGHSNSPNLVSTPAPFSL